MMSRGFCTNIRQRVVKVNGASAIAGNGACATGDNWLAIDNVMLKLTLPRSPRSRV
jgi:hypothetical protein